MPSHRNGNRKRVCFVIVFLVALCVAMYDLSVMMRAYAASSTGGNTTSQANAVLPSVSRKDADEHILTMVKGGLRRELRDATVPYATRLNDGDNAKASECASRIDAITSKDSPDIQTLHGDIATFESGLQQRIASEDQAEQERLREERRVQDTRELIARTAVKAAGTTRGSHIGTGKYDGDGAFDRPSDPRLAFFNQLHDAAEESSTGWEGHFNSAYASCTQATGDVIRCCADNDIWQRGPEDMLSYLRNSDKWLDVTTSGTFDSVCQPGDIIASSGHDSIYVGHDMTHERDATSNCNVYEASYGSSDRQGVYAGLSEHMERIDCQSTRIFRFVGRTNQAPAAIERGLVIDLTS